MRALFGKHSIIYMQLDEKFIVRQAQGLLFTAFDTDVESTRGKPVSLFLKKIKLDKIVLPACEEYPCKFFFIYERQPYLITIEHHETSYHLFISSERDLEARLLSESKYPCLISEENFGSVVFINDKADNYFDCRIGAKLQDFFVFDFEKQNIAAKLRKNGSCQSLVHARTCEGSVKRAVCSAKLVKRREETLIQILWHFEDMPLEGNHRWEELLLFVPDVLLRTDSNLNITYCNHSIYRIDREELKGLNLSKVLDEETMQLIENAIADINDSLPVHFEHQIRYDQNRRFNFNCLISKDANGFVFVVNNFVSAIEKDSFFHNSNENIYFLLEAFPDNIFIVDNQLFIKAYHLSHSNTFPPFEKDLFDVNIAKVFGKNFAEDVMNIISSGDVKFQHDFHAFNFEMQNANGKFFLEARVSRVNKERFILIVRDISAERKAVMKIEQQKQDYYELLRSIDEYFYSFSLSGECFVSSRVTEVLGFTKEDFESSPTFWLKLVHKDDRPKVLSAVKNLLETKSSITLSYRVKEKKTDFFHWIVDRIKVKYDENGTFKGIFGVAKDVSLQKKLISQNQLFSSLIESSHDLIAMTDAKGKISYINKNGLKFLNAKHRDTVIDRDILDYLVIENREEFFRRLHGKIENSKALNFETFLFSLDKESYIYADVSVFALSSDTVKAEKDSLAFIIKDVSERKEAKKALESSQLRFKRLVETMDAGIFVVNRNGEVEFTNKKMKSLISSSTGDLLGMKVYDEMSLKNGEAKAGALPHEWQQIREHPMELFWETENEEGKWIILSYVPIENENGENDGYMGIITDVTEIKKTELNLKEVNKELEQLLYSASHDLKGPITSTQGLVNLMKMEINDPQVDYYAGMMTDSLKKLENSVIDLLKVSTVKQGKVENEIVDLKTMIEEILQTYAFHPNAERVKIKFSFLSQRPFYSDASFLRTIFQNTIENAIKYAKPPGYDCFVNIEVKDTPKGIIFKVEDNGIGIPKVLQPKIFDMFFRGTQFAKGSGLGLFIVNSAVKRLGGQIIVESEENIGTTFWVKLPTGLPN